MAIRLHLHARDVTLLPEGRPVDNIDTVPDRAFVIQRDDDRFQLTFDGHKVSVLNEAMFDLLPRISSGTPVEWRHSTDDATIRSFRPIDRLLQRLTSTPAYQLFRAGFDIGDVIGLFNPNEAQETAVADSFHCLIGVVRGGYGKNGRLFFLSEGYIPQEIEAILIANGKLNSIDCYTGDAERDTHVARKLYVPYATPIGFNTEVDESVRSTWRRLSELIRRQRGGTPA